MKLFTTITSERGKPVTKSGNNYLTIILQDEMQDKVAEITILPGNISVVYNGAKTEVDQLDTWDIPL
jgi:hypothetical protein